MTWCITASNEDVDVDILFEENASIGKKMSVPRLAQLALMRERVVQTLECWFIFFPFSARSGLPHLSPAPSTHVGWQGQHGGATVRTRG